MESRFMYCRNCSGFGGVIVSVGELPVRHCLQKLRPAANKKSGAADNAETEDQDEAAVSSVLSRKGGRKSWSDFVRWKGLF